MKVEIIEQEFSYSPNGIVVVTYAIGETVELNDKLAGELIEEGRAKSIEPAIETPKEIKLEKKIVKSKKK